MRLCNHSRFSNIINLKSQPSSSAWEEWCLICLKMFCGTWDVWHATASTTIPACAYKLSATCKQTWQPTTVEKIRISQTVDKGKPDDGLWGGFYKIRRVPVVVFALCLRASESVLRRRGRGAGSLFVEDK